MWVIKLNADFLPFSIHAVKNCVSIWIKNRLDFHITLKLSPKVKVTFECLFKIDNFGSEYFSLSNLLEWVFKMGYRIFTRILDQKEIVGFLVAWDSYQTIHKWHKIYVSVPKVPDQIIWTLNLITVNFGIEERMANLQPIMHCSDHLGLEKSMKISK